MNKFYNHLENAEQLNDELSSEMISKIGYYIKGLEQFPFIQLPGFFINDYRTKSYLFVSENSKKILNHYAEEFMEGGIGFTVDNFNANDLKIFTEYVFVGNSSFLQAKPYQLHQEFLFTTNYRFKTGKKSFVNVLQKNVVLQSTPDGMPLINLGMYTMIDDNHYQKRIIHRIEKYTKANFFEPAEIISTNFYAPDPEQRVLTKRELEIIKWMADGYSSKQIADKLKISILTIKKHRSNILIKTNSKNSNELIKYVLKEGVI